jgi:hypothetical protein
MPTPHQIPPINANDAALSPSFLEEGCTFLAPRSRGLALKLSTSLLSLTFLIAGCGGDSTASKSSSSADVKPAEPVPSAEMQSAAKSMLGDETQILTFGDLALNGHQQFLAANVVPKTPNTIAPGTIVTRAVIVENSDGKWTELFRCDEHLKNSKGFLGLTPLASITGWRLQFEQSTEKGLQLYFTPMQGNGDTHVLPIGVRWNPAKQRYQSLDSTYERFLSESPTLENPRSFLK